MSDRIECRLRGYAAGLGTSQTDISALMRKAADEIEYLNDTVNLRAAEIERLTAANAALMAERASLIETKREQIDRLAAERDAALAKLAQYEEWPTEAWIINDPKGNREVELAKFGLRPLTEFDERCGFSAIALIARPGGQP